MRDRIAPAGICKRAFIVVVLVVLCAFTGANIMAAPSGSTEECLSCHRSLHPGIVGDWQKSRHAQGIPGEAQKKSELERRVSSTGIPENLAGISVGCAECHTMNPETHKDTFEHNGYQVHVVVTPADCATCHSLEAGQFAQNIMAWAHVNFVDNPLYRDLEKSTNGAYSFKDMKLEAAASDQETQADSCLFCHGTAVQVTGTASRETEMGEMVFPNFKGWPNQGVGRINPDASKGSCAACHARHQFSIEMARKPDTCSQCHKGPDVPASKVYGVSKHGNIYASLGGQWDFTAVPWKVGTDFTAPTCATCHMSLLVKEEGEVIAPRTHQVSDRLPWRIFGLIYAHPQPKSPDTTVIKNRAGLPLPTELSGEPVSGYLIDEKELGKRTAAMQQVCLSCHAVSWVNGYWARFENTIKTSNANTLPATQMVLTAWEKGLAGGPAQQDSLFNEPIERKWADQWLLYANSVRFSSAMAGSDYGVFDYGRWFMSRNLIEMRDWLKSHSK